MTQAGRRCGVIALLMLTAVAGATVPRADDLERRRELQRLYDRRLTVAVEANHDSGQGTR
jgi:hypothetical protein